MLNSPSAAFDAAVTADVRHVNGTITVAGRDVTDYVTKVQVDTSVTTDLPAGTTLVAGSTTTAANVLFGGAGGGSVDVTTLDLLHPLSEHNDAFGDLTGRSATVDLGFDDESLRQFTGNARKTTTSEASGSASVTLADGAAMLGGTVTLPAFGSLRSRVLRDVRVCNLLSFTGGDAVLPTNTAGIVTWALHTAGLRVTPPPRGALLSVPGVGGYLADLGRLRVRDLTQFHSPDPGLPPAQSLSGTAGRSMWFAGPYGPCLNPALVASGSRLNAVLHGEPKLSPFYGGANPLKVEGYVYFPPDDGTADWDAKKVVARAFLADTRGFQVSLAGGVLAVDWFDVQSTTLKPIGSVSAAPGWHWVALNVRPSNSTTVGVEMRVDGVSSPLAEAPMSRLEQTVSYVHLGLSVAVQAFTLSTDLGYRITPSAFTPDAYVDLGDVNVDRVPTFTGTQWDVVTKAAQAELGSAAFDTDGKFRFLSGTAVRASTTPARTLSREQIGDIGTSRSWDSIRNTFADTAGLRGFTFAWDETGTPDRNGVATQIFSLSSAVNTVIPAGGTTSPYDANGNVHFRPGVTTVRLTGSTCIATDLSRFKIWQDDDESLGLPGMYLTAFPDDTGPHPYTTNVAVSAVQTDADVVEVTVVNASGNVLYCKWPPGWATDIGYTTGREALGIYGYVLNDDRAHAYPVVVTDPASVASYGEQSLTTTNPFLTDRGCLTVWAQTVISDLKDGTLIFDTITAPGDPRIVVGDTLRIAGEPRRYRETDVRVMRVTRTLSTSGLTDEYVVRAL